jgi:ERCC4-related helicase
MQKFGFSLTAYLTGIEGAMKDFWNKMSPVITSIDTIKIEEHLKDLMSAKDWDVIVFDEAHHLTRKDYGVKADKSDRYVVGEKLKDKTKNLLFLTATPHQGDRNKFYNLVNLLDENIFKDEEDLSRNREKLNQIMIRQRKIDVTDEQGKPLFVKRIVTALRYEISKEEKDFFDALDLYLLTGYRAAERDTNKRYRALGFVMITFQKIAASSIFAIRKALEERLMRLLFIEMEKGEGGKSLDEYKREIISFLRYKYEATVNDEKVFQEAKENFEKYLREENVDPLEFVAAPDEIESLKNLLSKIPSDEDTKFKRLLEALNLIKTKNSEEKAIIFTEYLKTQDYIVSKLKRIYGEDDVVFIRGGDNQQKILAAKKFKKSAHFLVSTQAGGEGINLQHCHIMINYDMPWNPMKVEQRIGRIHRYLQEETAQVYNLFAAETIEDRIYQRLDMKLQDITRDIGDEEEREAFRENILGILAEQLNFEELYREVLKQGKEIEKITQDKIDDAVKQAQEIYEKLGDFTQNMERFNLQKYFKTKGNLSLENLKEFVLDYVKSEGKRVSEDNEGNYEFIIPDSIASYGGHKMERVTFDREKAIGEPSMEFMGIGHYLTDEIIRKCSGYGYGGRCARRQIQDSKYKGEKGIQANYTIEFQVPQSGEGKNKTLGRHFQTIVFDENFNYRKDLEELGLIQSDKKINEEDFSFANRAHLDRIEKLLNEKVQEVIEEKIRDLKTKYPNVVYKKILENIAIFVVK